MSSSVFSCCSVFLPPQTTQHARTRSWPTARRAKTCPWCVTTAWPPISFVPAAAATAVSHACLCLCPSLSAAHRRAGAGIMEADDRQVTSFHSPTVIPPSALDKPNIMKRYDRWRTCSHTSPRRSTTMVTLHDTRFVECRWWNDGWTVKTVVI